MAALPVEDVKVIGPLKISLPLYNVYLAEADEWSRRLGTELSEWELELVGADSEAADSGPEVLDRLHFIRRGQAAGLTLAQIGQVLAIRDRGQAPCQHVTDLLDTRLAVIDRQLAELAQLRTTIAILREHATTGDPATCSPEDVCRYL